MSMQLRLVLRHENCFNSSEKFTLIQGPTWFIGENLACFLQLGIVDSKTDSSWLERGGKLSTLLNENKI